MSPWSPRFSPWSLVNDEERVVEETRRAEAVQQLADAVVGVVDLGVVEAPEELEVVGAPSARRRR